MSNKKRIHYAWWILVSCCALQGATLGAVQNSRGLFYSPVCGELGFSLGSFTLQQLFFGVFTVAGLPLLKKLLERYNIRIVITAALVVFDLSTAIMAFMKEIWGWYVLCSLQGIAGSVLIFYAAPLLLSNWFFKKKGFAMGISGAASGLFGILINNIGAAVITSDGWRTCYIVVAAISFITAAPFTIFVMRLTPSEKGLTSYGMPECFKADEGANGVTEPAGRLAPRTRRAVAFVITAAMLMGISSCFPQHLLNYAVLSGLTLATGALMISISMAGNIGSKIVLGLLNDRFTVRKASYIAITASLLSYIIIPMSGSFLPLSFSGDALIGFSMAFCTVQMPLITGDVFDKKIFPRVLTYVMMTISFFTAVGTTVIGYLFDIFGAYLPVFFVCAGLAALCILLIGAAYSTERRSANKIFDIE